MIHPKDVYKWHTSAQVKEYLAGLGHTAVAFRPPVAGDCFLANSLGILIAAYDWADEPRLILKSVHD